jgi:predicted nucleotidyltransferase component of viral defense system
MVLMRILKDIFTDPMLGPLLCFKDGTAALFFYNLPRFSVDLDFDLLDAQKEEEVFSRVKKILAHYGTLKEVRNKRYSLFFLLSYENKMKGAQNIKIEINKRQFGSRNEIKSFLGIPMKVMIQEDMAAHKLVAMYERKLQANRDIFDVWFFLHNNWPVNKEIIEERTGLSYKDFLKKCIAMLEAVNKRSILSGVGELLDNKQKYWVKEHLIPETIFLLNLKLENLTS